MKSSGYSVLQRSLSEIKGVLHRSSPSNHRTLRRLKVVGPQPSQQEVEKLSQRIRGYEFYVMGWLHLKSVRNPQDSWEDYFSRNTTRLNWMGQREYKMNGGSRTPKFLLAGNRLIILINCKHMLPFIKKERLSRGWNQKPRMQSRGHKVELY